LKEWIDPEGLVFLEFVTQMKTAFMHASQNCLYAFGVLLVAGVLSGCAMNPVRQSYSDRTGYLPDNVKQRIPSEKSEAVKVMWFAERDYSGETTKRAQQNYALLGESSFRGNYPSEAQLQRQARKVGADLVLYTSRSAGYEERSRPKGTDDYPNLVTSKRFGSPAYGTDANLGMANYSRDPGVTREPVCDFEVSFWRSLRQQ
jgi:hypothetical protein